MGYKKRFKMPSAIEVNFNIGHVASARVEPTPEGFTHDWEMFVRGSDGAEISHFIEKVIFHLHSTFKQPRRVVKKPPFSVKESGYAGFILPIEIYLKNKGKPKKIQFYYDFTMQEYGILKHRYIFHNPNKEFSKKLLLGGGVPVTNEMNPEKQNKLPVSTKRRALNEKFEYLFGPASPKSNNLMSFENRPIIQIAPTTSPDPKGNNEMEISSSETIHKHEHQQKETKQKSSKRLRSIERTPSSDVPKKKRVTSPVRRVKSLSHSKVEVTEKWSETSSSVISESDAVSLNLNDTARSESSGSTSTEIKNYLPAYVKLVNFSSDHMVDLLNLGRRITEMMQNNQKMEEILNIVRDSGHYTKCDRKFVFDLGMLDGYTVQRLIQLVGTEP